MTRKQRVTRVVYGVYVVVVAAFVVSNIAQVGGDLFGERGAGPALQGRIPTVGPECGRLLEQQLQAIERARLLASSEPNGDAARARYASERKASGGPELERACASDPQGTDALAALARLDRLADSQAIRTATELSLVRLAAQSFISGHPK